jgi:mRNA interferase HigB
MTVLNTAELVRAARQNAPLRKALDQWHQTTEAATWRSIQDVRATFPSADGMAIHVGGGREIVGSVINGKGNDFRLITVINFPAATVIVREVLTHAEYNKDQWKGRL